MQEKIQKTNILYLLGYIFVPMLICALGYTICYFCFRSGGNGAVITTMVPTILAVVWWIFGGALIFKKKTTYKLSEKFINQGYRANQTFYGRGKTIMLDVDKGMIGLAFFWNPFQVYILPASRVQKAWVDDGKMGTGFMEGSSRVSFLFTIDGIKVRIDTFTSNQRFRMDDKHILTGISKADMMVQSIEAAKANSKTAKSDDKSATPDKSNKTAKSDDAKKSEKSSKSEKPSAKPNKA